MAWVIQNNELTNTDFISLPDKPFVGDSPYSMWRITDDTLYIPLMVELPLFGAFANCPNLSLISIPRSVKFIGREAFRNTQLSSVTIASDCTYFPTSFPDGCEVNFYPD